MGVKGIALSSKDDYVVGMLIVKREGTILVATEKGYGKRTEVLQYRTQTRGGKGVLTMRCTDKTGKMVNIMEVVDSDDLIVITDSGRSLLLLLSHQSQLPPLCLPFFQSYRYSALLTHLFHLLFVSDIEEPQFFFHNLFLWQRESYPLA